MERLSQSPQRFKILLAVLCFLLPAMPAAAENEKLAFIYYYGWYGNPAIDNQWLHWSDFDHRPPRDVSSSYYPGLGAYSSNDPAVREQHIRWIAGANLNVLIYSWWGKGDPTDTGAREILDLAADYALKVAFLIEPYPGRSVDSMCDDIEYLSEKYEKHPAFLKLSHRSNGASSAERRGVFFVYQLDDFSEPELKHLSRRIHNTTSNPILLIQTTDVGLAQRTEADGMFAYEAYQNLQHFYPGLVPAAKKAGLIFVPCVSPGFNINRTLHKRSEIFRPRNFGRNYDQWWEQIIAADAEYVAVISFNEWHEGTQIEPAVPNPSGYLSYEGAYQKRGPQAEQSYLRRTARWIELFQK
jgi:hypothetical protein